MKKAAFIYPTPGQSEQLYLAKYNSKHRMFKMINKISDISVLPKPEWQQDYFSSGTEEKLMELVKNI